MIKYRDPGDPTYRRFFVHSIFESRKEYAKLWNNIILDRLDQPEQWTTKLSNDKTDFGNNHVELVHRGRFGKYTFGFEIGLYRDGFHLRLDREIDYMGIGERGELLKTVFGDINRTHGWTREAEKVAPMMNSIIKEFEKFFKDKDNH
jgi:hypothetical protein